MGFAVGISLNEHNVVFSKKENVDDDTENLLENISQIDCNTSIIVSGRTIVAYGVSGKYARRQCIKKLKKYSLCEDCIDFCDEKYEERDKNIWIYRRNINVVIESNVEIAKKLASNGVKVLLLKCDEQESCIESSNIVIVADWKEIEYELVNLKKLYELNFSGGKDYYEEIRKLFFDKNRSRLSEKYFKIFRIIGTPYFKMFFKVNVKGVENIPFQNGLIIASNHIQNNDQFVIAKALQHKTFNGMAASTIKNTLRGRIFKLLDVIFVDRESETDRKNAKYEMKIKLVNGINCLIFPEGTRKNKHLEYKNEKLMPFKYGAVSMSKRVGAPILPIGLNYRGRNVYVNIGEIINITGDEDLTLANERLRDSIAQLIF